MKLQELRSPRNSTGGNVTDHKKRKREEKGGKRGELATLISSWPLAFLAKASHLEFIR
jgi:hypothetical protein